MKELQFIINEIDSNSTAVKEKIYNFTVYDKANVTTIIHGGHENDFNFSVGIETYDTQLFVFIMNLYANHYLSDIKMIKEISIKDFDKNEQIIVLGNLIQGITCVHHSDPRGDYPISCMINLNIGAGAPVIEELVQ